MRLSKYHCLQNDFFITTNDIDIKKICNRRSGIGADGVVILKDNNAMYYNSDGTKANFCGNAVRCIARYLHDNNIETNNITMWNTSYYIDHTNNKYTLKFKLPMLQKNDGLYFVDAGVKHIVLLEKYNEKKAKQLQDKYKVNITFYDNYICKTYELGCGLTKGCGSGLISIITTLNKLYNIYEINLNSPGGTSHLLVENGFIYLTSEVHKILEMEIIE